MSPDGEEGNHLRPAWIGLLLGAVAIVPVGQLLRSQLFLIGVLDPPAIVTAVGLLAIAAWLAAYVPARRVRRVEPVTVLREE